MEKNIGRLVLALAALSSPLEAGVNKSEVRSGYSSKQTIQLSLNEIMSYAEQSKPIRLGFYSLLLSAAFLYIKGSSKEKYSR
ncbi:MAG: hypothetical protein AABY07_02065 [Nanoarchaeota archaeon]